MYSVVKLIRLGVFLFVLLELTWVQNLEFAIIIVLKCVTMIFSFNEGMGYSLIQFRLWLCSWQIPTDGRQLVLLYVSTLLFTQDNTITETLLLRQSLNLDLQGSSVCGEL